MAKFEKASDNVVELFNEILENTTIPMGVRFEFLSNNKQKELYRINKLNDLIEKLTDGLNFVIIINEEIFEQLTDEQQKIALDECLAGVVVSDMDVVGLEKPNFSSYMGVLEKYGHEPIITLKESVKSLFDAKKQREDEERAIKKAKKKQY